MDRREYVCNQMYKQHDLLRKGSWTDADKLEYMELNIAPYSRYWRMGMKKALKHAIRLLREEEEKADRKTEHSSEKQNNCDTCKFELYCPEMCDGCCEWDSHYEPKAEPQTDKLTLREALTLSTEAALTECRKRHGGCESCYAECGWREPQSGKE